MYVEEWSGVELSPEKIAVLRVSQREEGSLVYSVQRTCRRLELRSFE
jgi:hypothetical protein